VAMRLGTRTDAMPDRRFGAFELRRLDWDTTHFGRKMGALALTPAEPGARRQGLAADLRLALAEASDDGYAHVILRVPAEQLQLARAAEQAGLRLVDVAVDLVTALPRQHSVVTTGVRKAAGNDLDALRSIADGSFEFSRFSTDPFFTDDQVTGFYRQWITNLCDGLAEMVLVAVAADEIVGFTSCAVQRDGSGRIPLIATSDAHRRQGIGRALIDASIAWFSSAGLKTAWVKTQAANYPALALYHRAGFTIGASELTFSAMLNQPRQSAT
jgi:ribosomal protein S18 acetylase RimI-like enzyme